MGGTMITKFIIGLIHIYQSLPLACHQRCRYIPTCSDYAITSLKRHGLLKGSYYSIKRILRCNSRHAGGIDLVPEKRSEKK